MKKVSKDTEEIKKSAKKPTEKKSEKKPLTKKADKTTKSQAKSTEEKVEKTVKAKAEKKTVKKVAAPTAKADGKAAKKAPTKVEKPKTKKTVIADPLDDDNSPELSETVTVTESKPTKNGKFEVRRAKDGRFFFCLYASNYTVIAYSQIYSSSTKAMVGINSVIANAKDTPIEDTTLKKHVSLPFPKWEIYIDKAGEYRFRLYATNGLCVCHSSHGYSTKSGCKGGIESIIRFSAESEVDKSYKKK